MRNFQLVAEGIGTANLLNAALRDPSLWGENNLRQAYPGSPHAAVDDIWLRFNELPKAGEEAKLLDELESVNYRGWWELPEAQALVLDLMRQVRGERIGRVMITRLAPGKRIEPHEDQGAGATYYDRFHVVLQGKPGSVFVCGEEEVTMLSGQVWWFQNAVEHAVVNGSDDDRVHLVVDIRTPRRRVLLPETIAPGVTVV